MWFSLALAMAEPFERAGMSEDALRERIDEYGPMILRIAYAYLHDRQKAEDICQEVYVKLYFSENNFVNKEHEKAWLIRVSVNLCKDYMKSAWSKRVTMDHEWRDEADLSQEPSYEAEKKEEAKKLFRMVSELDDSFKSVVILYYYEDLSTKEIAKVLSVPEATVRSRLKRAREKLQKRLSEEVQSANGQ